MEFLIMRFRQSGLCKSELWYYAALLKVGKIALCVLFLAAEGVACYRHPVPDDFDRYIYEAIVRGESQSVEMAYAIVKRENPRAESSSILDSPQHLRELEPMWLFGLCI